MGANERKVEWSWPWGFWAVPVLPHSIAAKEVEEKVFRAIHDQIELVINLEHALAMIERLPSQSRKAFNYEAQIAKIEEEIERYQKLKLGLYENFIGGVIDKSEYF